MEQLNKNKHTHFRDRRTAAEQRTPEVTCYWAEHTVWTELTLQIPPSPSQARGQIQGSQARLCTAHARPTPAATQRGDPLPQKPRVLALNRAKNLGSCRQEFCNHICEAPHSTSALLLCQNQHPTPSPGAAGGTPWTFTTLQIRACLCPWTGHVCPDSALAMELSGQDITPSLES